MTSAELPTFYYAQGTSYLVNLGTDFILGALGAQNMWVKGVNPGEFHYWSDFILDVFPNMLDTSLWNFKRVPFPASALFIGPSIEFGVEWLIADITSKPVGTPFALGGYSQGAAVMSRIYNECRSGRLRDRRGDLRAVVAFGNPMREEGHSFPGSSGYSGACDIALDTKSGHGSFPALDSIQFYEPFIARFARLQNTEDLFWDFVMPNEPVNGVGDSADGARSQYLVREGLRAIPILGVLGAVELMNLWTKLGQNIANPILGVIQNALGQIKFTDPKTGDVTYRDGGGHILYPAFPPPLADGTIPSSGDTCYQIAAKYINRIGAAIWDELHPTVPAPTAPASYQWFSSLPNE